LADELIVLFVGSHADARDLDSRLQAGQVPALVTRVSGWSALASVSGGWDVVVAGGAHTPAHPDAVRASLPEDFTTPVIAVVDPPLPVDDGAGVWWFTRDEVPRLLPVLHCVRRASLAEGIQRRAERRAEILERQLRQQGRLEAVGQMAAGVAHEFNNVLTVISGYSEQLLARAQGDADVERLVLPIQQAGFRGSELSQRLLAFSRVQSSAVGESNISVVVREAMAMLAPLLGERVSLTVTLADGLPFVRGQAGPLIEILTNLAVNSRDAMPEGGLLVIETRLTAPPTDEHPWGKVALTVRDTGEGMDAATLARACDPFFTTKPDGVGTGLGLALVRDIVEQSGGTLDIQSAPGQGTQVTIVLPGVEGRLPEPAEAVPDTMPQGGSETVLVVEDDLAVREIVTQFLRGAAYQVIEARDAVEAMAVIKESPRVIDLLVSDIVLPGQSGPELAGALREFAPGMRTLFISGYPSDAVGIQQPPAFLAKPFSRSAFLQAVRKALYAPRYR
jgi:signal transduction histidine kinase/CheY-like chemotaxis protein